jgi:hypothetical protein
MKTRTALAVVAAAAMFAACNATPTAAPTGAEPSYSSDGGVFYGSGNAADEGENEAGTATAVDSATARNGYGIGSGN